MNYDYALCRSCVHRTLQADGTHMCEHPRTRLVHGRVVATVTARARDGACGLDAALHRHAHSLSAGLAGQQRA